MKEMKIKHIKKEENERSWGIKSRNVEKKEKRKRKKKKKCPLWELNQGHKNDSLVVFQLF
jgi:hypothetical protein